MDHRAEPGWSHVSLCTDYWRYRRRLDKWTCRCTPSRPLPLTEFFDVFCMIVCRFQCDYCKKRFSKRQNLQSHIRSHTGPCFLSEQLTSFRMHLLSLVSLVKNNLQRCNSLLIYCKKSLYSISVTVSDLRQLLFLLLLGCLVFYIHVLLFALNYIVVSGFDFEIESEKVGHTRTHLSYSLASVVVEPFQLRNYMIRHVFCVFCLNLGEQPYSCNICNKRFARQNNLTRHKLIHSKVRRAGKGSPKVTVRERISGQWVERFLWFIKNVSYEKVEHNRIL